MIPDDTTRAPRNHAVWMGVLVTLVGVASYFTVFARFPVTRDVPWVNLPLVVVGVALSLWGVVRRRTLWSIGGLVLSALLAALLFWYVFGVSASLPPAEAAARVGEPAPGFTLPDTDGDLVSMEGFAGRRLLVVFYRGFW